MYYDKVATEKLKSLVQQHSIKTIFETGTLNGDGTWFFSDHVPTVMTIELNPESWQRSTRNLMERRLGNCWAVQQPQSNYLRYPDREIFLVNGSSPDILREALRCGCFRPPYLFYLDAHWNDYWPLRDEIRVIAEAGVSDSVIIIHDFFVPGKPFGYYSPKGQRLDLEYVRPYLLKVNPKYEFVFNDECDRPIGPVGILYVTPPALKADVV